MVSPKKNDNVNNNTKISDLPDPIIHEIIKASAKNSTKDQLKTLSLVDKESNKIISDNFHTKPLIFSVKKSMAITGYGTVVIGQIIQGSVKAGDQIIVAPNKTNSKLPFYATTIENIQKDKKNITTPMTSKKEDIALLLGPGPIIPKIFSAEGKMTHKKFVYGERTPKVHLFARDIPKGSSIINEYAYNKNLYNIIETKLKINTKEEGGLPNGFKPGFEATIEIPEQFIKMTGTIKSIKDTTKEDTKEVSIKLLRPLVINKNSTFTYKIGKQLIGTGKILK
jgi:translation elongation factor EF-Tu-like GTPase